MTQPFYFPDGRMANNAEDLFELCQQYPDEATNYLVKEDLEKWLAYIGSYDVAECAVSARQTELPQRQKLEKFLNKYRSLSSEQIAPAAVTETKIEDNLTAPETASTTPDVPQEEPVDDSATTATDLPLTATLTDTTEVSSGESSTEPITATPPEKTAESLRSANAEDSQRLPRATSTGPALTVGQTQSSSSQEETSEEKPSFFQVIAKFIVKILYRNKA
jgi:hypothetical protein